MTILNHISGLKPVKQDRYGPAYSVESVTNYAAADILVGNHIEQRARKNMATDFEKAAEVCDEANKIFKKSFSHMMESERQISEAAKKTSGNVRKAANDLAEGLAKIEKLANFDRLERYVTLLERAASAMESLALLQESGKLDKIAGALK